MQQSELQTIGQHIQAKLQQLPSPIRLRIRCAFREEALLVLAEHLLHVEPSPRETFATVAEALQEYTPELMKSGLVRTGIGGTKFLPVRIYLRVAGYQQPYDSFVFSLKPLAPPTSTNPPIPAFVPPVVIVPPEPATQREVEPENVEIAPTLKVEPVAEVPLAKEIAPVVEVEPTVEVEPAKDQTELLENPIAEISPAIESVVAPELVELEAIEVAPVAEVQPAEEVEPVAEVEIAEEAEPIAEVESIPEAELTEKEAEPSENPIAEFSTVIEPEVVEVAPIVEVKPVVEPELVEELEPLAEVESIPEAELIQEEAEPSENSIAEFSTVIESGIVEPEVVEVAPVVEVKPVVEPELVEELEPLAEVESILEAELIEEEAEPSENPIAEFSTVIEPRIVEPEAIEVAPIAEVESTAEAEIAEEVESIAVESTPEAELIEEEAEPSENPIAEVSSVIEPLPTVPSDPQIAWVSDRTIAEVVPVEIPELEPASSEAFLNELVFTEGVDVGQLTALEDQIPEKIVEPPIVEEKVAELPAIALEDLSVEPEAIEEFSQSEGISSTPEEITLLQEVTLLPAAIDSVGDNASLTAAETSLTQSETQDEPEAAIVLLEPTIEEPTIEEPTIEQSYITFPEPISSLYSSTPNTQSTTQDFFPEHLAITDAELVDSESLAELETADEPETIEVFDPSQLDTTLPGSALAPELRETPEPENLAIDHVSLAEKVIAAESAIAGTTLLDEPYTSINDLTTHIPTVPATSGDQDQVTQPPTQPVHVRSLSSSSIMMGTAIALFGLLGGWYILSRPCVLGSSCKPLQQAQQISQAAFQTVQSTESAIAIAKAYDDLGTANKLLRSIPSWSGQYATAQALFANNESKSAVIGQLVKTLRKGNEAANRSQNPPHPLPEWREIQRLWRESITALEKIPNDTAVYPVAQRKATEYRANLDSINKRVVVEQQAQEEVDNAKKTAQLAETRTGIATSAEGWQEVYTSWQAAINLLKGVPKGAAARLEAEELLKIYQTKLAAAGTRREQENTAITAYTEAIAQAEQAQNFQQKNQWQNAIGAWEGALANVQKVAQGTTPYAPAQPLIATYQTALTQAQGGLRISEAIQAAKPALDRTCGGTPKVCQYDAAPTAIRVQITYGYDQMVENAMTSAQTQGNSNAQAGVVSQVNTFLQELALISQTAQAPIDLYNANGSKFGTYSPQASGFIPQ